MATKVDIPRPFRKLLKELAQKYPKVLDTIEGLVSQLEKDERPGDKIPNIGYDVYKVRLKNVSAGKGKSGGFRVIYYLKLADNVVLLTLYSKTDRVNISAEEIRKMIQDLL